MVLAGTPYTDDFYREQAAGSRRSAEIVLGLLLEFLPITSVVDVGCGVGTWLAVFREHGIEDILGVDGDYVDRTRLHIPADRFYSANLDHPLRLARSFDLAMSVEVAEHIPEDSAEVFVASLVTLAPIVLFSAAIPFQPGTHHVNERWPSYWARLFREHGYVPIDAIRGQIWQNDRVKWWYTQNILLFARLEDLARYPALRRAFERTDPRQLDLVHPRNYSRYRELALDDYATRLPLRKLLAALPAATTRALIHRSMRSWSLLVPTKK